MTDGNGKNLPAKQDEFSTEEFRLLWDNSTMQGRQRIFADAVALDLLKIVSEVFKNGTCRGEKVGVKSTLLFAEKVMPYVFGAATKFAPQDPRVNRAGSPQEVQSLMGELREQMAEAAGTVGGKVPPRQQRKKRGDRDVPRKR